MNRREKEIGCACVRVVCVRACVRACVCVCVCYYYHFKGFTSLPGLTIGNATIELCVQGSKVVFFTFLDKT